MARRNDDDEPSEELLREFRAWRKERKWADRVESAEASMVVGKLLGYGVVFLIVFGLIIYEFVIKPKV